MTFLVYEQDPLVRADILETLTGVFDAVVKSVSSLSDVKSTEVKEDQVFILSVDSLEREKLLDEILGRLTTMKVVIISNSPPDGTDALPGRAFINRPFTSEGLVNGIKSVLSGPQSDPR